MRKHYVDAGVLKADGKCPWSGCECARAPLCIMSAAESCAHLVQNRVSTCNLCKKVNGPCEGTYLCFRDARDAERKQHVHSKPRTRQA